MDAETSAAEQGQAVATTPPGAESPALDAAPAACANCGAPLSGPYCAQCGQRASARLISTREIFRDTLEDQFTWNSSLPRTLHALLLNPGQLTREYIAGRIASYVPPMRIYLAASLLFFLTLSFVASPERLSAGGDFRVVADTHEKLGPPAAAQPPAPVPARAAAPAARGERPRDRGGFITIDTTLGPGWLRTRMAAQARRLKAMDSQTALRTLVTAFWNMAPKVAFLLLPVLALILKILYVRRRRLYVEHFVFALHVQSVAFLALTVMLLVRNGWVGLTLFLGLMVYTYVAMLRVYGQGWFRTLLKFGLLSWTYFVVLSAGMFAGILAAVLSV